MSAFDSADLLARPELARALAYGGDTHTETDIALGVADGRFQEWSAGESVLITEVRETPQVKFLHVFLAEGKLAELEPLARIALQWGRNIGCTRASFIGRFGWLRSFARDLGFKEKGVSMECEL